jgi:hypothetical protein
MCLTSASGCSLEGAPFSVGLNRRPQSVLDLLKIDAGFAVRGFAEGDDADFIFSLRVDNGNGNAGKKAERLKALFTIGKAIVFKGVSCAFENSWCVNEVKAMFLDVDCTLSL